MKGEFILFYITYSSDEHLFLTICEQTIKKEVKNKRPETLGVELGILTDETLACLPLGRWWVCFIWM